MAHPASAQARAELASDLVAGLASGLSGLAEALHAHPELSMEERESSERIAVLMESGGFSVERGIGGLPTAFRATGPCRGEGPRIAFLAEYDALPEIGHACGHNLIAAMSAGAALATDLALARLGLPGTVVLMGTPAEEKGGGKVRLVDRGCFSGIDCALMLHPSANTRVQDISLASTRLVLTFRGRPAHASAAPWDGANALEALIQTFNLVNALRSQLRGSTRINGIITKGGTAVNIIPELAEASFGIRAADRTQLDELAGKVADCARSSGAALGVGVEVERIGRGYDAMMNNSVMESLMAANLAALGEEIHPFDDRTGIGSSDMGNVTRSLPGIQCYLRVRPGIVAHTEGFAAACSGEDASRAVLKGAKALAMTALDIFGDPALLSEIRAAFLSQAGSPAPGAGTPAPSA